MNFIKFISIISISVNTILIFIILIRSPNEQSLQENLDPFKFFESSSRAENSIDNLIQLLTFLYFSIALFYTIKNYF